uniref:Uncharacterized protein n=1 Tax=Rhabditophanes sp. KR3021 TaxID=114890 RepID=A0AC35UBW3_9BILA
MSLDLLAKSLNLVNRDIYNISQHAPKSKKNADLKKVKKQSRNQQLNSVKGLFKAAGNSSYYDQETGEIMSRRSKRPSNTDISNIVTLKKGKKGMSVIEQYRDAHTQPNEVGSDYSDEEEEIIEVKEELEDNVLNTIILHHCKEADKRRMSLKSIDRSLHGRHRVPKKKTSKSMFTDEEFAELSRTNNTLSLNSSVKKLTSEEEIKKALGIRR